MNNKNYFEKETYTDTNLELVDAMLSGLLGTNIVGAIFPKVLDYAIDLANKNNIDVSFISGLYDNTQLVEDVHVIIRMAKSAISFGTLDYIKSRDISPIELKYVKEIISELENLNLYTIARHEWLKLGLNYVAPMLGFEITDELQTLTESDLISDNVTLQEIVMKLDKILYEMNFASISEIMEFVGVRQFLDDTYYTDVVLDTLGETIELVASLNTLDVLFPNILSFIIDKASDFKLDIEFLNGEMTLSHVKADAMNITNIAKSLIKFGVMKLVTGKAIDDICLDYFQEVITELGNLETFKINEAQWMAALINCGVGYTQFDIKVDETDFANVDWELENELLKVVVREADLTLKATNTIKYTSFMKVINKLFAGYIANQLLEISSLNQVINTISAVVDLQVVDVMIPFFAQIGIDKVKDMDYDLEFILDSVTDEELVNDVRTILSALRDVVEFNAMRIWFNGDTINYENISLLHSAIDKLFNLNIIRGNENELVKVVFDKLDINTNCLSSGTINMDQEAETVNAIITAVAMALRANGLYTIRDISNYINNVMWQNKTMIIDTLDNNLVAVSDILMALANDPMLEIIGFAIAERYIPTDKYEGLIDIYNIYPEYSYFREDLLDIAAAIKCLADLHMSDALNDYMDYPYSDTENINAIIRSILGLNYFNLEGRMTDLLNALDDLFPGYGLDQINGENIDLASDAEKIVKMYESFAKIASRADFPIKNTSDIRNGIKVSISYFFIKEIFAEEMNIINTYMETTIYGETGPVVLLVLVPLVKKFAPDYWDALDLDNYNDDKINNDVPLFQDIIEIIMRNNPTAISEGKLDFNSNLEADIKAIINDLTNLELLKGHMNALTELLLRDFVYGKSLGGVVVEADTFDVENVEFGKDAEIMKQVLTKVFEVMRNEGINSLSDLRKYINKFNYVKLLKNESAVFGLGEILELVAEMSLVQLNVKQAYMVYAVPRLETAKLIDYVDYREATNEEMIADLITIASIVKEASGLGIGTILDGGDINYDQATTIQNVLGLVGTLNYIKYNADALISMLSNNVKGLVAYDASYEKLDIAHDLVLLGQAYAQVAYALDSSFAYRNIKSFKELNVKNVIKFAYENANSIASAVDYIAQMSIAPYFLPTLVDLAKDMVPDVFNSVDPYSLILSELTHDTILSAELLHNAVDSNIFTYLRTKSAELPTDTVVNAMIQNIFDMYLFEGHYSEIISALLEKGGAYTLTIDLSTVDYDHESAIFQAMVTELLDLINEYGINRYEEVISEAKSYKNTLVNQGKKAFARRIKSALAVIDGVHIINIVDQIDQSVLLAQTIIPIFEIVRDKFAPERFKQYLDITGYTTSDVESDIHLFALALHEMYDSRIHEKVLNDTHVGDECVPYLQEALRYFAQIRILDMKKQDFVGLVGELLGKDLSALDISSVDLVHDAEIMNNVMYDVYTAFVGTNKGRIKISMFGDTPTMTAVINVLAAFAQTDLGKEIIPFVAHAIIFSDRDYDDAFIAKIHTATDDGIDALYALLEMGAFSNNGIDFTNKALTDRVFNVISHNISLGKYQKYFDKLVNNVYIYGVINLDYSVLVHENEVSAMRLLKDLLIKFKDNYATQLRNEPTSLIKNATFESDVTELFKQSLQSNLISQIFISVMTGTAKALTKEYGSIAFFEGMTNDEFVNRALPELSDTLGYVVDLRDGSKYGFNYKDTDAISKLVHAIVDSKVMEGHIDEVLALVLKKVLHIDIDAQEFIDADIDYNVEAGYLDEFLDKINIQLQKLDLDNRNSILNNEFLTAISEAGHALVDSKVLKVIIKPIMIKVVNKINTSDNKYGFVIDTLNNPEYTNDDAMEDYVSALTVIEEVVAIDLFADSGIDPKKLEGHIGLLLDTLFGMNAMKGNEKDVMTILLGKLKFGNVTFTFDLEGISDDEWTDELANFTDMMEALAKLCAGNFDITDIDENTLTDEQVKADFVEFTACASKSNIGRQLFKQLFARLELSDQQKELADFDNIDPEDWAEEVKEILDLFTIIGVSEIGSKNIKVSDVLTIYDIAFGLNGKDGIEGVKKDKVKWLNTFVDMIPKTNNFAPDTSSINDSNVDEEIDRIRGIIDDISQYVDNPEDTLVNNVTYDNIVKCQDYDRLYDTFIKMSESLITRNILIGVIGDNIISASKKDATFSLSSMTTAGFNEQHDSRTYDEDFWNEDEFMLLALLMATANAYKANSSDDEEVFDITTMDLGRDYANVQAYNNVPGGNASSSDAFPSQTEGPNKVGLRQILQLMNLSKVFELSSLGGEFGVISKVFDKKGISKAERPFGTVTNTVEDWNNEIIDLTDSLYMLKDMGLLNSDADISEKIKGMDEVALRRFLEQLITSDIIRPTIACYVNTALAKAINEATYNVVSIDTAKEAIANKYVWLGKQADPEYVPVASEEEYSAQIDHIIMYMTNPRLIID